MQSFAELTQGAQPGSEKRVDWELMRRLIRRAVPVGDDFRGAGIRVRPATAATSVTSAALSRGVRYKWRYIDGGGGVAFMRTCLSTAPAAAAVTDWPLVGNEQGYLYVPEGGAWDSVSFLGANLLDSLHLMRSDEKIEDAI
jgi:hypothetical protein